MARKPFGNLTWVDINLDSKAKKEFKAMFQSGDDSLLFDVQACLDGGLKFSLSWDEKRSAYRCTVVCNEVGNINQDKGFGSFAKSPLEALCVAAYKITTVTNGGEWVSPEEDDIG